MKRILVCASGLLLFAGFSLAQSIVSPMPKRDVREHWPVEGKTPVEAWMVQDGMIVRTGQPNGFWSIEIRELP